MLFHIGYTIRPEHRDSAQARFRDTAGPPPAGVTMMGRWHVVGGRRGFLIAEASELEAVAKWTQQWSDLLTFEIDPVLDDEQFMQVIS